VKNWWPDLGVQRKSLSGKNLGVISEGDVLTHVRLPRRRFGGTLILGPAAARIFIPPAPTLASIKHFHLTGDDFGGITIVAALILPFSGLDSAFYIDPGAFVQVFTTNLSQPFPGHDAVPFRGFLLLAALVSPAFGGCNIESSDLTAALGVSNFRVSPEISDYDCLVYHLLSPAGFILMRLCLKLYDHTIKNKLHFPYRCLSLLAFIIVIQRWFDKLLTTLPCCRA
jgi:hypothetical protein